MAKLDDIFEEYKSLRLQGQSETEARHNLCSAIQCLDFSSQIRLRQCFQAWEAERLPGDFDIQERSKPCNISLKLIACPACESPNPVGLKNCQVCATPLILESRDSDEIKTATIETSINVKDEMLSISLYSTSCPAQFVLYPQLHRDGIRIGRCGAASQIELDLTEPGAVEMGVSRLHAILIYDSTKLGLFLADLNSTNGTFVNGSRLAARTFIQIQDGDELCLGRLKLRLSVREERH